MSAFHSAPVKQYMTPDVRQISPSDPIGDLPRYLVDAKLSCLAVVEDQRLVGVVSRTDVLRHQDTLGTVGEYMTPNPIVVSPDTDLSAAGRVMVENGVHRVFVVHEEQLVGVCSTWDIMMAVKELPSSETISQNMSTPILTVDVAQTLEDATRLLADAAVTGLIVTEDHWPVGVFTQLEALDSRYLAGTVEEAMDTALICLPTTTSMRRAAQQGIRMGVRRIVASENRHMRGVLSGLDFAAFVARTR